MNNDTIPYYKCCDVDMFHIVMDKKGEQCGCFHTVGDWLVVLLVTG